MPRGDRFYVTTPIYYVNDAPHLGHAYTTVACDALARFRRLDGEEVLFTTGTDEHGQKVEKSALAAGMTPQAFCDRVSGTFRAMNALLGIDTHDFVRTTEQRHLDCAAEIWRRIAAQGDIFLGKYGFWYSVRDEAPYDESELVNGKAPTGADVEWVEEENYFFRLSAWQDRLLAFYEANPDFIGPQARRNEVVSFVKGGLKDLSISRTSFNWGIPVPGDDRHIMYVWIEALSVYLTGAGFPDETSETYRKFWPCSLHMVGKDIIRFHCVYWPAFLMAAGLDPPRRVFGHGWWTVEGQKMSKSLGNFITPRALVDRYGLDSVR
ncbi:MAG: methionine--tRNA ligase, partial [Stellaceae bacterium]